MESPTVPTVPKALAFHYCLPKGAQPCYQFKAANQQELNLFLLSNGGKEARFDADGTAQILTRNNGTDRFIYCKPNAWLRSLGPCQFSALSEDKFFDLYKLI